MEFFRDITIETLMITGIVMVMMLLIEYFNVFSGGGFGEYVKKSFLRQTSISAFLGFTPGCVGVYAVVSLYLHRIIGFGGLLAALLATVGDEAFIMIALIPKTYLLISLILLVLALAFGLLFSGVKLKSIENSRMLMHEMHQHKEDMEGKLQINRVMQQLKNMSFPRAILIFAHLVLIFGIISGVLTHNEHPGTAGEGHPSWDFMRITFLVASLMALGIVTIVSDHFLEKHLWEHIIRKHFLRLILWTFGTLLVTGLLLHNWELRSWMQTNQLLLLLIAVAIGIIPISGPHIAFITLFAQGAVPFSILLANSIVQDGHGALPLFAESRSSFFLAKGIKLIPALIVGLCGLWLRF